MSQLKLMLCLSQTNTRSLQEEPIRLSSHLIFILVLDHSLIIPRINLMATTGTIC